MDGAMWRREWATLSGGEAQRMGLAVAVSLGMAEVLLLDGAFLSPDLGLALKGFV